MERKKLELLMSVILIFCACILAGRGWEKAASSQVQSEEKRWTVVLDAGHGGFDTGANALVPEWTIRWRRI